MTQTRINANEIKNLLPATETISNVLNNIPNWRALLKFLAAWIDFNAPFGAGVSNLAGQIALRSVEERIFLSPDKHYACIDDASYDVASAIFYAAIDEFGGAGRRPNHRKLAQATLKGLAMACSCSANEFDLLTTPSAQTRDAIHQVCRGYGMYTFLDDESIFKGIGFHTGSEILADEEFNIFIYYLEHHWQHLIPTLSEMKVSIRGVELKAMAWLKIHTKVEAEHFDAALGGANLAIEYYTGNKQFAKAWILEGFQQFADTQQKFMTALL